MIGAAVLEARATGDTVVVFQQQLAQALVDAGADIVVGGHAHRLQGGGRFGSAFVAYGLGNFAFYARPGPGASTGVVLVTATGRSIGSYEFRPALIRDGVPRPLEGEDAAASVGAFAALRGCTGLTP